MSLVPLWGPLMIRETMAANLRLFALWGPRLAACCVSSKRIATVARKVLKKLAAAASNYSHVIGHHDGEKGFIGGVDGHVERRCL